MKRVLFLSILLASCGIERGDTPFEDQVITDAGMPDARLTTSDVGLGEGQGAGTMAGTWLMVDEGSTCVLGVEQLAVSFFVVEFTQNGRALSESRRLCRQNYSELLGLKIRLSDAARHAIEFRQLEPGLISDLQVGGSYSSGTILALWGLDIEAPYDQPIPSDEDDPIVVDSDGDGNPAITFTFEGSSCERYTAQKQFFRYNGTLISPNDVRGSIVNVTDVEVYGSTSPLCGVSPPVRSNDPESRFRMVRIDGLGGAPNADTDADGTISCDEADPYFESVLELREADDARCESD